MASDAARCIPCEDGRKLVLAAVAVRVIWAVLSHRFRSDGDLGVLIAHGVQLGVSALVPVLAYRLALNLRLSRAAAVCAGAAIVVDPIQVDFAARGMSEPLFAALVGGFLLAWLYAWQSGRTRDAALAGLLGGAASLISGAILPFGGLLALVALWRSREQPRWAALVVLCGLCWAGVAAPRIGRSGSVDQRIFPVAVQVASNLSGYRAADPDQFRRGRAAASRAEAADPAEDAFSIALFALALLGLRMAVRAPGAWFLIAWLVFNLLRALFAGSRSDLLPLAPVLGALAGAGLAALFKLER